MIKEKKGPQSSLVSRNITVSGRRTSVRLEPEMWDALKEIARRENCKVHDICSVIQLQKKDETSLTAAIRVFLMLYYRAAATEEGHRQAGHGALTTARAWMIPGNQSGNATTSLPLKGEELGRGLQYQGHAHKA